MDLMQAIVSSGLVLAGITARGLIKRGRDEKGIETLKTDFTQTRDEHGRRLDEHDDKFEELNTKFVPRQELTERMDAIRESQRRTERMVEALILPRVRPIVTGDETRT